jgi:ACS family hexuronate transporter-like MFS transporter
MSTSEGTSRPAIPKWSWWIVWMLFLATVVNYLDRQTLLSTADHILRDFRLDKVDYGVVEMSFGLSYAIFLIVAGVMSDRVNLRWLFTVALIVWSVAGFATGTVHTFIGLIVCRVVLAIGEAFNWPCSIGVIQRVLPREARSLGNGIFNSGMTVGAVSMPLLVQVMVDPRTGEGWRWLFQIVGLAGSVWVALWLFSTRGPAAEPLGRPAENTEASAPALRWYQLFALRRFWTTMAVGVSVNIAWHFLRVWMLFIMKEQLRIQNHRIPLLLAGYFLVADFGSIAAGFAVRWLTRTRPLEQARTAVMFAAAALVLLGTAIVFTSNPYVMIPLLFLVGAGLMGVFMIFYSLSQDVSPGHSSKCVGIIGSSVWFIISGLKPLEGALAQKGHYVPMILSVCLLPMLAAPTLLRWPRAEAPALAATQPGFGPVEPANPRA